jgi:hypothetical protein
MNLNHVEKLIARIKERPSNNVNLDTFLGFLNTAAQVAVVSYELETSRPSECGAVGCIAGYAATLSDDLVTDPITGVMFITTALKYLGISGSEADDLFNGLNTWEELHFNDDQQAALTRLYFLRKNGYFDAEQFEHAVMRGEF